jgi:hypothetical protein
VDIISSFVLSLLYLFWKMKIGWWNHHGVLCLPTPPPINFWTPEPIYIKLGMCIMAPEPISTACFINPSHQSVCLYVYPLIAAMQRLGKNVTAATNTHTTIEALKSTSSVIQRRYIPEGRTLHNHRCENLKSYNRSIVGRVVFYAVRVVSKESRR